MLLCYARLGYAYTLCKWCIGYMRFGGLEAWRLVCLEAMHGVEACYYASGALAICTAWLGGYACNQCTALLVCLAMQVVHNRRALCFAIQVLGYASAWLICLAMLGLCLMLICK